VLIVAAALALAAAPTDTWNMGGGRSWMNPPRLPGDCGPYQYPCTPSDGQAFWDHFRKETAKSLAVLETAAKRGDSVSMRLLGYVLIGGVGVEHDEGAAMGWFYEAALRGDAPSMFMLGRGFADGVGVAPDPKLADFWLKRAAEHGFVVEVRP